ncbi:GNAT family N-acetyltransferase [Streptomyces sp. NPDC058611]|uniref:GNAT family N-acetyltransferase n=1 Tax=unclassified Streptomyces TaxID=2593676 RepID=UPI003652EABE
MPPQPPQPHQPPPTPRLPHPSRLPLSLRPFRPAADITLLRSWVTTPAELMTWVGPAFSWPLDDGQLSSYAAEPGRRTWTALSPDGQPVGHASLAGIRLGRILIAPAARGRGLGTAMVSLVVERAFGEPDGVPELGLGVWAHNTAALRVYERLGFRTERVDEDVVEVDGVRWSAHEMRLARSER